MKSLFQSKPLHLTACILLSWKGIGLIAAMLLKEAGMSGSGETFFFVTGFMSVLALVFAAVFSGSLALSYVALAGVCLAFLVYWVFFVLLVRNRAGAGIASVGLLILCGLDLPITMVCSFTQWWSFPVCIVFHTAIFITVVLLRRSRLGVPTQLSEMPESV